MVAELWEWDEAGLERLVNDKIEERSDLEYKSASALGRGDKDKDEISKDVSAFANSAGGSIVYGIVESSGKPPRKPVGLDGINPAEFSKEWLEQIINSRIHPRIQGIRINPVTLTGDRSGQVAYVVHVPEGVTAYQAGDYRYYRRYNFQALPMEDYELRLRLNKLTHPEVTATLDAADRRPATGYDTRGAAEVSLHIKLRNVGRRVADRVFLQCLLPNVYVSFHKGGTVENTNSENYYKLAYYYRQPSLFPMFPDTDHQIMDGNSLYLDLKLSEVRENDSKHHYLQWTVFADSAPPNSGQVAIYELFFPT